MTSPLSALLLADFLGIAALVVAVLGFVIAIHQIRKAVGASEAARDATVDTEHLLGVIELLGAIPQMQRLARDLNVSVKARQPDAVTNHLEDWCVLAASTRGMLREQPFHTEGLESRLAESTNAAAAAIDSLSASALASDTKRSITVIAGACEEAGVLLGQLKAHPGTRNSIE